VLPQFSIAKPKNRTSWGMLGYVPNYRNKKISRKSRIFKESGHVDAIFCDIEDDKDNQGKAIKA
jgi:hypothetical protein